MIDYLEELLTEPQLGNRAEMRATKLRVMYKGVLSKTTKTR